MAGADDIGIDRVLSIDKKVVSSCRNVYVSNPSIAVPFHVHGMNDVIDADLDDKASSPNRIIRRDREPDAVRSLIYVLSCNGELHLVYCVEDVDRQGF